MAPQGLEIEKTPRPDNPRSSILPESAPNPKIEIKAQDLTVTIIFDVFPN